LAREYERSVTPIVLLGGGRPSALASRGEKKSVGLRAWDSFQWVFTTRSAHGITTNGSRCKESKNECLSVGRRRWFPTNYGWKGSANELTFLVSRPKHEILETPGDTSFPTKFPSDEKRSVCSCEMLKRIAKECECLWGEQWPLD